MSDTAREAAARAIDGYCYDGAQADEIATKAIDAFLAEAVKGDGLVERLRAWAEQSPDPDFIQLDAMQADCAEAADRIAALTAERDALIEDRARFPDRPDGIGHMIQAHIGNLKHGKEEGDRHALRAMAERDRLAALLREARDELNVIGSYENDLGINTGLRGTARAYNRLIARIDAALTKEASDAE